MVSNNQTTNKMNLSTSMFFPYLKAEVNVDYIIYQLNTVCNFGVVGKVDMVSRTDKTGAKFNMAYVHMIEWNASAPHVQQLIRDLTHSTQPVKLFVSDTEYWTVLENKYEDKKITNAPKKAKRAAPPPPIQTNLVNSFDEETYDLVDATYVWQIEAELAKSQMRVRELENQVMGLAA
jgi:hypothetical protein